MSLKIRTPSSFQEKFYGASTRVNVVILCFRSCVCAAEGGFPLLRPVLWNKEDGGGPATARAVLCPQLPAGPRAPAVLVPLRRTPFSSPRLLSSSRGNNPRSGAVALSVRPLGSVRACVAARPAALPAAPGLSPERRPPPGAQAAPPRRGKLGDSLGSAWRRGRSRPGGPGERPGAGGGLRLPRHAPHRPNPNPTPARPAPAADYTRHLPTRLGQHRAGDLGHGSCLGRGWWGARVGVGRRPAA